MAASAVASAPVASIGSVDKDWLELSESSENSRNIPSATFIEDLAKYTKGLDISALIKELSETYGKYKYMEGRLVSQKRDLLRKIPETQRTLDVIDMLVNKAAEGSGPVVTHYQLADNIYSKARVNPDDGVVYLWIGANIMVKYTHDEAKDLLSQNLVSAQTSLKTLNQDLSFLKDQITIQEVNIARLHNYNVSLRSATTKAAVAKQIGA